MSRVLSALTVFAVVATSGAVAGLWTNRWTSSAALEQATARMAALPLTLGDWDGRPDSLDDRQLAVADVSGHVYRHYVNRRTGAVVSVLLLCGRPGPLAVHTPEVCFHGAGFDLAGKRARRPAPAAEDGEFWVGRFQRVRSAVPESVRAFWAWNADGRWVAAESPRGTFAHHPALYKLYLVRQLPREDEPLEGGPIGDLLRILLPALRECLFPAP